ncbi:MAG: hypothetical protein JWM31_3467 [Solirubrobacterales bacterium]|nr:hypothetical protein [Solirubrobacterales bacterium]
MPPTRRSQPPPAAPPPDHTRWMARAIELIAIAGAVVFAYLHSGS